MLKRRLRSEKAWQSLFRTGVRFPSPPPDKVDSSNTIGIETINLFHFLKYLIYEDFLPFGKLG